MASFSAGTTFTDGVANDVTAAKLAALVNAATPTSGLIQDRTAETTIASNDTLLFGDASASDDLKRITVSNLFKTDVSITSATGTAGTVAIGPTGDTNTGIFFPAADTIAFSEGGAEAMRIDSSGNVGIGALAPAGKFTVTGVSGACSGAGTEGIAQFTTGNGSNTSQKIQFGFVDGSYGWIQSIHPGTSTRNLSINPDGGEVYIAGTTDQGAYNLQVNGTGVWGAGAYVNGSDSRIKEDIQPITSGLDVVDKLNPVTYKYKETWSSDQSIQSGFIAQELLTALDGQIYVDGVVQQGGTDGYYSVAYQNLIPILAKAIQELKAENDSLKSRIEALEVA